MGRRLTLSMLAGALLLALPSTAVLAADFPEPPPPYIPPPVPIGHQWYLRGHVGLAQQKLGTLEHVLFEEPALFEWLDQGNFDAAPTFGIGIGFKANEWLRFDLTGEYRGKAHFSALDRFDFDDADAPLGDFDNPLNTDWGTNEYTAKKSEWLFLANAYVDFAHWDKITPYVGAGIGASYNVISDFRDNNIIAGGGAYANTAGKWNLAWALHAGVGFKATENLTVDLGYSFVHLGDAQTGILTNLNGTCTACEPMYFRKLTSHDLKLGVRYAFGAHGGGGYTPGY